MPAGKPPLFETSPAIAFLAAIFFQVDLAVFALAKAGHAWKLLADGFKQVQNRLPRVREIHLRSQPHINVKILAERTKRITHNSSHSGPIAPGTSSTRLELLVSTFDVRC